LNKLFLVLQYLRYLLNARDEHSLHSPFAYIFYTEIIRGKTISPDFVAIENLRKELKRNHTSIQVTDLGAGSGVDNSSIKTISSICRNSEKKPVLAQLIYRIIQTYQPKTIFDLGTSLGITTLYEAKASPSSNVYTFEGCPNTAAFAKENFRKLSVENIETVTGNIDTTLPETIQKITSLDFVFFDANHRYEPTLRYFQLCLQKAHENSIFVFDDIYWSPEMRKAWNEIKKHPSVGMSMDLFSIGIVFFRKKQPVQHFTLK
jgi:predicted O-methyltransferase YrrM